MSSLLCSLLVMLIFTPIYLYILKTNDNIFVTILIYFICIAFSVYVNYNILNKERDNFKEKIAIFIWIMIFVLNGILTYYPLKVAIFYDFAKKLYGR